MNTLKVEAELAQEYGYKPLSKEKSEEYRKFFTKNIPEFLRINGDYVALYTTRGTVVCKGYKRIVVGDCGAFVEFDSEQANLPFAVKKGQEFRINSHIPKYIGYTINDQSEIKIYKQKRGVAYADYKSGMFYISVHEVSQF